MAKKQKKRSMKNDSRGYSAAAATTTTTTSKVPTVTRKNETKLSDKQQQEHLQSLLLLSFHGTETESRVDTDTTSRDFYKRMDSLYSDLINIGFHEQQVEQIVIGLASTTTTSTTSTTVADDDGDSNSTHHRHMLALQNALDWACLSLPTGELPPILTEAHLRDAISKVDCSSTLQVLQVASSNYSAKTETTRTFESTVVLPIGKATAVKEDIIDQSKAWILSQYQYESDEDVPDEAATSALTKNDHPALLLPEQVLLAKLDQEVQALKADVNDEATNYMRSKHEIKDLKKSLQKLEGERNKLKAKVTKLLAESSKGTDDAFAVHDTTDSKTFDELQDDDADIFGMFEEAEKEAVQSHLNPTTLPEDPSHLDEQIDPFQLSSQEPSIDKDWTGKTPKTLLEDHCKKHQIPRPKFAKILGTRHGCRVIITCKPTPLEVEHAGPFFDFKDAQEYVSTHAMYKLTPELPLYRVLPPIFSNLWKRWLQLVEDAKKLQKDASALEREERILQLISLIPSRLSLSNSKQKIVKPASAARDHQANDEIYTWEDGGDSINKHSGAGGKSLDVPGLGRKLQMEFTARQSRTEYLEMKQIRGSLPIHAYREQILETIAENTVTVLHAETGAGKTTQCPQFILEQALLNGTGDSMSILCTQPRRISALSVAERVAEEMCERLGDMVGYQIRMESKRTSKTRLLFCTTGVVLRRLQDDPNLTGVTHVVVDEVHERQWQIDFLLIALRNIIQTTRPDLKVILMSATLDAKLFCSFFGDAPLVSVPGRTFPVANYFLEDLLDATGHMIEEDSRNARRDARMKDETQSLFVSTRGGEKRQEVVSLESQTDVSEVSGHYVGYSMATQRSMDRVDEFVINYDLIEDVLTLLLDEHAENTILLPPSGVGNETKPDGSVLVFLPGMGEIRALSDRLSGSRFFGNSSRFEIIPMHSSLSPQDQKRAFLKPRAGCRKIILATNIAETSVTIPDCVCVIDSGLGREVQQDKRFSTSKLVLDWCSKASARQRAGRAGRVQAGICCRLYSSRTHQMVMQAQAMPELQRVPLEEVCLSILAGKLANSCMDFLRQAPQPPREDAVKLALNVLQEVGAVDKSEALTPLGHHLSKIPVHVRLAKMLIFGSLFGCLDKVLTIVGSLSCKSPFSNAVRNATEAQARHKSFRHESSDFLTSCKVWDAFRRACECASDRGRAFCRLNYLNWTALAEIWDMRRQNLDLLSQLGFVRSDNKVTEEWLLMSEYNRHDKNEKLVHAVICAGLYPNVAHIMKRHKDDPPLLFHKREQLYFHSSSANHKKKILEEEWIVFHEKFGSGRTTVSATTPIHPFSLLLFGGSIQVKHLDRKVIVDDWIELDIAAQTGVMFRELRQKLNTVLAEKIESPDAEAGEIIQGIVHLLSG